MEEQQIQLSKILGLSNDERYTSKTIASWAEIYVEIGKLKERANNPQVVKEYFPNPVMPLGVPTSSDPNLHYHNGSPCYNNPCMWCSSK